MRYLITGGAGFIGSNFVKYVLRMHSDAEVLNLDKLTYAGNLENLAEVAQDRRYSFLKGDIGDPAAVEKALEFKPDVVINFAAETHVDRSISGPAAFLQTDIIGTHTLLEACRLRGVPRYVQISTDEVYGSIDTGSFREGDPLRPNSPYAASKAAGDLLCRSYWVTYQMPLIITRSSNNYGPNQYPEKVIPLFITNALEDQPLPLYGDGLNVRDWLYVEDNCAAIDMLVEKGQPGEVYNIGGGTEIANRDLTSMILDILGKSQDLIRPVKDRPGHDRRYSLDCAKVRALGWRPRQDFPTGLRQTVRWYQEHSAWWQNIKSGEYKKYYLEQYGR